MLNYAHYLRPDVRHPSPATLRIWVLPLMLSGAIACDFEFAAEMQPVNAHRVEALAAGAGWSSSVADNIQCIAFGDVDGDGDLDLAVGNANAGNRLYGNTGSGLEATASWSSAETDDTRSVAFGDADSDGDLDLVVGNYGQSNRLYANVGATLDVTAVWSSADGNNTNDAAWGDVDGDGDLDLAVGDYGQSNRLYSNTVGSLETVAMWISTDTSATTQIAFGDVDGDGISELAVGNYNAGNRLYGNTGSMLTTTPVWSCTELDRTSGVAFGDVDGDGDLDLAAGNSTQSNRLYENGGTALGATALWSSSETDDTLSAAFGDADGDGDLDLALGNANQNDRLYENTGTSLGTSASWSSNETDDTRSVAFGDVHGDGDLDLAAGSYAQWVRLYNSTRTVHPSSAIWSSTEAANSSSVAWGDVDGDGDLDLAVGESGGQPNHLYENVGTTLGSTAMWASIESDDTMGVAFADVDGDGDLDLLVANFNGPNRLYSNTGTGLGTLIWSSFAIGNTRSVAFGDVNGDGNLDAGFGNFMQSNVQYENTGAAFGGAATWSSSESVGTYGLAFGDVDGDGDLDLVVGNDTGSNHLYTNSGSALGTASNWSSTETDSTHSVALGDTDSDGDLDLAVGNSGQNNRLYGNTGTTLGTAAIWSTTEADDTRGIALADVDGDGTLDLAAGNYSQNNRLYDNTGTALVATASWSSLETQNTRSVAFGDADGDGAPDLAGANNSQPSSLHAMNRDPSFGHPNTLSGNPAAPGSIGSLDATAIATGMHSGTVLTASPITVPFTLYDDQSNGIGRVELQYSYGGANWQAATITGAPTNFASSPSGIAHTLQWDSAQDCVAGQDVRVRLRLIGEQRYDTPFPWQRASTWIVSTSYRINAGPGVDDDGDGFARCFDCNPTATSCTTDCSDSDADGIMDCLDRCDDFDDDGYGADESRIVGAGSIAVQNCTIDGSTPCSLGDATCAGVDCDDNSAAVHPGILDDTCDGVDTDCDGPVDEDYVVDSTCGSGICRTNNTPSSCMAGVELDCVPGAPAEALEVSCTDLVDNDCDGLVDGADDNCVSGPCVDGDGDGFGNPGSANCANGPAFDCDDGNPAIKPGADDSTCNGIDDNCDSIIDGAYSVNSTCGVGFCRAANTPSSCIAGTETLCTPAAPLSGTDTTCNAIDDDCDGFVDEDFIVNGSCGIGFCRDTNTASSCIAGTSTACQPGIPFSATDATCDGVDDDCDGTADENYLSNSSCGLGVCQLTNTPSSCVAGTETNCAPGAQFESSDLTCDGVDGDCDGLVDEDYMVNATCGTGYCRTSNLPSSCNAGAESVCSAGTPLAATDATCDGVDDDCDGAVDEDYVADVSCGVGLCQTMNTSSSCSAGVEIPCSPGSPSEIPEVSCGDALDNDCDGGTDGADADCSASCIDSDGDGYGLPGDPSCAKGAATDCDDADAAINPGMEDSACDGVDNDCDGSVDENYLADSSCGQGICQAGNTPSSCSAGAESACAPGSQDEGSDLTCDGVDGDCDGLVDEDYIIDSNCGAGWCNSSNTPSSCAAGVEVACVAGVPFASTDLTCNGVDDDCDGQVDEEYVVDATCGTGYCLASNTPSTCTAGTEISCTSGAPLAATDATCDGVDDDCDGVDDEDYAVTASCGVGYCQSTNTSSTCAAGVETACLVGVASEAPEQSCTDGIDNDCDGMADATDTDCDGTCSDGDGDTVCDAADNCPGLANATQLDTDGDAEGDACDLDDDGDGIPDLSDTCPLVFTSGTPTTPIAYVGPDQQSDEHVLVTLDGSSSCLTGGNAEFTWTQVSGPTVQVSNFNTPKLTFLTPGVFAEAVLVFELRVSDDGGESAPVTVSVTVNNTTNEPPTADAGVDQIVHSGAVVTLDASGSTDVNGDVLTYSWSQSLGPLLVLDDVTAAMPSFTAPSVAVSDEVIFELVVTDIHGAASVDSVAVTAMPIAGPPVFVSSPSLQGMVNDTYQYDSNGTLEVAGELPMTFAVTSGPAGFTVDTAGIVSWVPQAAGSHDIAISAGNDQGSAEQRFQVQVFAAPVVVSTPNVSFLLGAAYAYDDDGLPEALGSAPLSWSLVSGPVNMFVHALTGRVVWTPSDAAPVSVTLQVTNDYGTDQQSFLVSRDGGVAPHIAPTANALAAKGVPYRYDEDRLVDIVGMLPGEYLQLRVLEGPSGLIVSSTSGEMGWLPTTLGLYNVSLGLVTPADVLLDRYDFTITVGTAASVLLRAVADAIPSNGPAPLSVMFDGSGSQGSDGLPILDYIWDTQSGPLLRSITSDASHMYGRPGGYTVALEVWDTLGYSARDKVDVAVLDGSRWPPSARIATDTLEGEGSLTVQFDCNCSDPDGEIVSILWQYGDGDSSAIASPEHHFDRPGTYTVSLTVEDDQGLFAYDSTTITVLLGDLLPPVARIESTSIDDNGPMAVVFHASAEDRDGVVEFIQWTLPNGTLLHTTDVIVTVAAGEYYTMQLEVVDNDGLTGYDERTVMARSGGEQPPRIVSNPSLVAFVGHAYAYNDDGRPSAQGSQPMAWSLGQVIDSQGKEIPEGMTVDSRTGVISWTPSVTQVGEYFVPLQVENGIGTDSQNFVVAVHDSGWQEEGTVPMTSAVSAGCACDGGEARAAWAWTGILAWVLVWRRRRGYKACS